MRSYLSKDTFFKKMKKKPDLQKVLDNIANYSDADIDALTGPHFPQWIKDQLKEYTKRGGRTADEVANEIANKMIAASQQNKGNNGIVL
jgi:hypothetical protein